MDFLALDVATYKADAQNAIKRSEIPVTPPGTLGAMAPRCCRQVVNSPGTTTTRHAAQATCASRTVEPLDSTCFCFHHHSLILFSFNIGAAALPPVSRTWHNYMQVPWGHSCIIPQPLPIIHLLLPFSINSPVFCASRLSSQFRIVVL